MRPISKRAAGAVLAVVLALGLAGCGDDEPTGPKSNGVQEMEPVQALEAATKALEGLDDVTFRGTTSVTGETGVLKGAGELVVRSDDSCQSTFTSKKRGRLITRTVGKQVYVFADPGIMRGPLAYDAAKVASLRGKWQVAARPADRRCNLAELLPEPDRYATFEDAGTGDIDGTPVRLVSGEDDDGSPMTVAIATEGTAFPLEITTERGGASTFSLVAHDSGVAIDAPPKGRRATS
ncbi:MAG: hypothetical protein NTX33_03115 [Propionibacteriales bacterium]|nr:hypothetical protein [Propionibacteriales bacterium]